MMNISSKLLTEGAFQNSTPYLEPRQHPSNVLVRNLALGVLGMIANVLASAFIAFNRKMKLSLKVTLVGLSLNDLVFSSTATVYGCSGWIWRSEEPQCWPVVYVVLSTLILSHCLTCLLALHNFIAVFVPLKCNILLTDARSFAMVLLTYVVGYSLSLSCLGINLPANLQCFVVALLSRTGLGVLSGIALACVLVTITINIIIFVKLRKRRKVAAAFDYNVQRLSIGSLDRTLESDLTTKVELNAAAPHCTRKCSQAFSRHDRDSPEKYAHSSSADVDKGGSRQSFNPFSVTKRTISECATQSVEFFPNVDPVTKGMPVLREHLPSSSRVFFVGQPESSKDSLAHTENDVASKPRPCQAARSKFTRILRCFNVNPLQTRQHRRKRLAGTSNTLLIMTFWYCFLAFPLLVDGFYLTIWEPDIQQFSVSFFGILVSSLNSTHALANPFIYAWRFVQWRKLISRIRLCCQGNGSVTIVSITRNAHSNKETHS